MLKVKRIMTKESEEKVVNIILEQVRENNMTISNLKEVTAKVINELELNATLEKEDVEIKGATLEGQVQEQLSVEEVIETLKKHLKINPQSLIL